jgi:hypothetical protein
VCAPIEHSPIKQHEHHGDTSVLTPTYDSAHNKSSSKDTAAKLLKRHPTTGESFVSTLLDLTILGDLLTVEVAFHIAYLHQQWTHILSPWIILRFRSLTPMNPFLMFFPSCSSAFYLSDSIARLTSPCSFISMAVGDMAYTFEKMMYGYQGHRLRQLVHALAEDSHNPFIIVALM